MLFIILREKDSLRFGSIDADLGHGLGVRLDLGGVWLLRLTGGLGAAQGRGATY